MKKTAAAATMLFISLNALAINKCKGPNGTTVFQDAPCSGAGETLTVRPATGPAKEGAEEGRIKAKAMLDEVNRRLEIRKAIEERQPLIGMTISELQQAMGSPDRANLANYEGTQHNQLIYERHNRTIYVYTDQGFVKAIQNTEAIGRPRLPRAPCLSALEIRNMETSANSITLSEAERVERLRQIGEAKKCRN